MNGVPDIMDDPVGYFTRVNKAFDLVLQQIPPAGWLVFFGVVIAWQWCSKR